MCQFWRNVLVFIFWDVEGGIKPALMPQGTKFNANTCSEPLWRQLQSVHSKKLGQLSRAVTYSPTFKTPPPQIRHMWILFISHRTFRPDYLHTLPCSTGLSFVLVAQGTNNFLKARFRFLNRSNFFNSWKNGTQWIIGFGNLFEETWYFIEINKIYLAVNENGRFLWFADLAPWYDSR